MGVYRSLLEEEIEVAGVLDDNNNVDLKEIEDIVNDQDANAAEQDRAQEAEFADPGTSVDDIMDESAMAIYEFENAHAKIMQAVGLYELSEAAVGREFLFEAGDIKTFFGKIKDALKKFFTKVWQVLQRWAGNIGAAFSSNKRLLEKHSADIDKGYAKLSANKAEAPEIYPFDNVIAKKGKEKVKTTDTTIAYRDIKSALEVTNVTDIENLAFNDFSADRLEASINSLRKDLCGKEVSAGEFGAAMKEFYIGEKKKEWMSAEAVKTGLGDTKDMKKEPTELMKKIRDQFKSDLKTVDGLEKQASKLEDAKQREKYMGICTRLATYIRNLRTTTETVSSTYCYAINKYAHQARSFALKYIAANNKAEKPGFQKESTEYGFLGKFF